MSTEETRRVATQVAACVDKGRFTDIAAFAAPGADMVVCRLEEKIPTAGAIPFEERPKELGEIFHDIKTFSFNTHDITVEGNTAVIEGAPRGETHGGKVYENNAMIKLVIKDGRVETLKEYVNFFAVFKFMGVPGF
ncbi:hypothetical protein B0H34DRAFT_722307 [Crassisporium funariophilum]|nr:hypothetical protein B0H34DRAFT_722307 [Crassisporium funariophilum]